MKVIHGIRVEGVKTKQNKYNPIIKHFVEHGR